MLRKLNFLFFSICFATLAGCSSDDSGPVVQRIGEIEVFDVGNTGNSSDIRVRFTVENIGGVSEFRIMLVPTDALAAFDQRDAVRLSTDQYFPVEILTTDDTYSERLPEILDVNGEAVKPDKKYGIRILSVGDQLTQLSLVESNEIELQDHPIYTGRYEGTICCIPSPGISGALSDSDEFIVMEITGNDRRYNGMIESLEAGNARLEFTVENDEVPWFRSFDPDATQNGLLRFFCAPVSEEGGIAGSGNIVRDLTISINFPPCLSLTGDQERNLTVRRVLEDS